MKFLPFQLERIQSTWEADVDFNLCGSGVRPIALRDLADTPQQIEEVLKTQLSYPEANGSASLRRSIASLYPGATEKNVLVTIGCSEANAICLQTLAQPGEEVITLVPNYMQLWGMAHNLGMVRKEFHLVEDKNWAPDLDELEAMVTERTRLITLCNPNNPTGSMMTEQEMERIIQIAERVGAWILADEVYRGAERLQDDMCPTFWGRYDRVAATGSMSKALGLPGLRIGWVVCPEKHYDEFWMRHEYSVISAGALDMKLAEMALAPAARQRIMQRTRASIRSGYATLEKWLEEHPGILRIVPPQAAAIAFAGYNLSMNSMEFAQRLICEKSVFVAPGEAFGIDQHFRIGFGQPENILRAALERIHEFIAAM